MLNHGPGANWKSSPLIRLPDKVEIPMLECKQSRVHNLNMGKLDSGFLRRLASKYIWWQSPEEAIARPKRIIAQVMNMGDYGDVQIIAHLLGDEGLREVLLYGEPGQFNERSWAYWHYRLGLCEVDCVPALPARRFI